MKEFKIRSSAIGQIMSGSIGLTDIQKTRLYELEARDNGLGKPLTDNMKEELSKLQYKRDNPELPEGVKSFCQQWIIEQKFNRRRDWSNKFVEKGLRVEHIAIEMLSVWLNEGIELVKNEEYFQNDFIKGTPDVLHDGIVYDTKCPWDIFKFPFFEDEPDKDYWWQLQGYMAITSYKKARLAYCLIDTPAPLIQQELRKLYFQTGGVAEDWSPEKYSELADNFKFNDIDDYTRIRIYEIERDDSAIESIYERVKLCRKYIDDCIRDSHYMQKHMEGIDYNPEKID